jgi:hypothetical protein
LLTPTFAHDLCQIFFLLAAAGVSSDAIKIVIEISVEAAAFFMIKNFFTLIFDFLEAGNVFEVEV